MIEHNTEKYIRSLLSQKKGIFFITGIRKCGKSEMVERYLNGFVNRIYFGTLPQLPEYNATIQRHVKRRGLGWKTLQTNGNLEVDIRNIYEVCEIFQSGACLIDGIGAWLYELTKLHNNLFEHSRWIAQSIVELAESYPEITFVIIDIPPWQYLKEGLPSLSQAILIFYGEIKTWATELHEIHLNKGFYE